MGKSEGKRPFGRHKRRWEDNTKIDIQETGSGRVDCIDLAQDGDRWRALINLLATDFFFQILAHPVFKM